MRLAEGFSFSFLLLIPGVLSFALFSIYKLDLFVRPAVPWKGLILSSCVCGPCFSVDRSNRNQEHYYSLYPFIFRT